MKKTLIVLSFLVSPVLASELYSGYVATGEKRQIGDGGVQYVETSADKSNGGVYYLEAGETKSFADTEFSNNYAVGKGGAIFAEGGAQIELSGEMRFVDNCHNARVEDGFWYGDDNDIYLSSGEKGEAHIRVTESAGLNRLYVESDSGVKFRMYAYDGAFSMSDAVIGCSSLSGTYEGGEIILDMDYELESVAASLNAVTLVGSDIFVNYGVVTTASGISLDAASTLTGDVVLVGGGNSLTLNDKISYQLSGVTLKDGSLALTLTDEQLQAAVDELRIELGELSIEGEVAFTAANSGCRVTGYTAGEDGVVVTIAVPEPATATLSLLALAALAARRRRG